METNEYIKKRMIKLTELKEKGINPYPYSYNVTHHSKTIVTKYQDTIQPGDKIDTKVSVAGRVILQRDMGKAMFMTLQDQSGRIQVYFRADSFAQTTFAMLKKVDIGDFLGIEGSIFKTRKGEVTIYASSATLLAKSLRPLPEKYHGLKDTELRYRQRYLDLIMNPEVKTTFIVRSKVIQAIREFLIKHNFIEMDTPTLQVQYGGANARPFITKINAWDMNMYLSISPELYLKRLLVGGFEKVFTIARNFRNEGVDKTHNPEFTMLEYYWAYTDYNKVMEFTEQLIEHVVTVIHGKPQLHYQGTEINFKAPWRRLTMKDAVKKFANIDIDAHSDEELFDLRRTYNIDVKGDLNRGTMIQLLFEKLCEDKLIQPTHIIDHPKESTPLCKLKRGDNNLIERFESYVFGIELTNGYSELNDPILQREALSKQAKQLRAGFDEAHPMDEDFVQSIEYGMPPAGGLGLGIDRLVMLITDEPSLRDVILFPTMKPQEK